MLREFVTELDFGVVFVQPTGKSARTVPVIAHKGNSFAPGTRFHAAARLNPTQTAGAGRLVERRYSGETGTDLDLRLRGPSGKP